MELEHVQGQVERLEEAVRRREGEIPVLLLVTQSAHEVPGVHDRGGGGGVGGDDVVDEIVDGLEVIPLAQGAVKVLPLILAQGQGLHGAVEVGKPLVQEHSVMGAGVVEGEGELREPD